MRNSFPRISPQFIPTRPKPKPKAKSFSFEDRVRVLVFDSTKIIIELKALCFGDSPRVRQFEGYGKVKTSRVSQVWVPKRIVSPT